MKNKAILFLFIKIILLLGVSYLLFSQLSRVPITDWLSLRLKNPIYFILSCFLLVFNWGFEWLKWNKTIQLINTETTTKNNFRAFMAGIATGLLTPNMLGNFIGRMYYFKRKFRPSIVLLTILSNFTQFFASIAFGFISLLLLKETPWDVNLTSINYLLFLFCLVILSIYFFFEYFPLKFIKRKKSYLKLISILKKDKTYRFKILFYSIARHFVFTLQFWLMFNAFEDALNSDTFFWIWQIFLWTTLVPSLWFGKLVIRESIALLVLGSVGFGQVEILTTSILIWLVNLAFPAIISIFICKQNKLG